MRTNTENSLFHRQTALIVCLRWHASTSKSNTNQLANSQLSAWITHRVGAKKSLPQVSPWGQGWNNDIYYRDIVHKIIIIARDPLYSWPLHGLVAFFWVRKRLLHTGHCSSSSHSQEPHPWRPSPWSSVSISYPKAYSSGSSQLKRTLEADQLVPETVASVLCSLMHVRRCGPVQGIARGVDGCCLTSSQSQVWISQLLFVMSFMIVEIEQDVCVCPGMTEQAEIGLLSPREGVTCYIPKKS